jgi:ABC-type transporter Mla subunit MlaD
MEDNQNSGAGASSDKGHSVMDSLKKVKSNIESFAKEANISQLQDSVKSMVKEAQKDFSKLVNKDLVQMKKKFDKEKAQIEKTLSSVMTKEMASAKKFIAAQKKEINVLQNKLEKLVAAKKKSPAKKKVAKKKASKKSAKKR